MSKRDLVEVIDQILVVAPDLEPTLASVRSSVHLSAPEIMWQRWNKVAQILNENAMAHPKAEAIQLIFSGKKKENL